MTDKEKETFLLLSGWYPLKKYTLLNACKTYYTKNKPNGREHPAEAYPLRKAYAIAIND